MPAIALDDKKYNKIMNMLKSMVKISDSKLSERTKDWEYAEKANQSYVPAATADRMARGNAGKASNDYIELSIPYCYAVQMAMHTYLSTVFLSRDPILQVRGRNGQGQDQIFQAEALLDYQISGGRMLTPLYLFLYDTLQYGVGFACLHWDRDVRKLTAYAEQPMVIDGVPVLDENNQTKTERREEVQEFVGYEGHRMSNVRPKEMIIDTRVGFSVFQEGEFCGRRLRISLTDMKRKGRQGIYFNTENISAEAKSNDLMGDNNALIETNDMLVYGSKRPTGMVNLVELYVKVVPSELGIGKNDDQEIWLFTVANGDTLIGCEPSGWIHGQFPFLVQPMEMDAYGLSSRGVPVIGQSLNQTMDWLVNSHMFNVRKAVNNEFLYDPSLIDSRDFNDPRPGKRIRLRPSAYGKDVRTMVHQFSQVDYTRNNLSDVTFIEGMFQRVFGTSPQTMGAMNAGGRKSATEVRTAMAGGMSRLKVLSEYYSATSFSAFSSMLLSGCRQMYEAPLQLRIAGNMGATKGEILSSNPMDLAGDFDLVPVDGTLPLDRFAMAAVYKELLMGVSQLPSVAGRYDTAGIFAWIAKMSGIKNLDTFEIKAEDEQKLLREAQLGNMVTAKEAGVDGEVARRAAGGMGEGAQGAVGAPTISGMGAAG